MDVEPFGIALTIGPGNDVRGAQQGRVGDAGQRAAALPVIHQARAKNTLADPLHHQPFSFGCMMRRRRQLTLAVSISVLAIVPAVAAAIIPMTTVTGAWGDDAAGEAERKQQ
jgi:hypothetical protein